MNNLLKGFGKIMIIALGIFIGVVLLFTACTAAFVSEAEKEYDKAVEEVIEGKETLKENTIITVSDAQKKYSMLEINGTLENKNEVELDSVNIEFLCYDANGVQVGTANAYVSTIPASSLVKWDAHCLEDEATSAKLHNYSVYKY